MPHNSKVDEISAFLSAIATPDANQKRCKGKQELPENNVNTRLASADGADGLLSIAGKRRSGGTLAIQTSRSFSARFVSSINSTLSIKICSLELYDYFAISQEKCGNHLQIDGCIDQNSITNMSLMLHRKVRLQQGQNGDFYNP